jgi:hypothetical protein
MMLDRIAVYAGSAIPPALIAAAGVGAVLSGARRMGARMRIPTGRLIGGAWVATLIPLFLLGESARLPINFAALATFLVGLPIWVVGLIVAALRRQPEADLRVE